MINQGYIALFLFVLELTGFVKCRSKSTFLLVHLGYQKKNNHVFQLELNFLWTTADVFNWPHGKPAISCVIGLFSNHQRKNLLFLSFGFQLEFNSGRKEKFLPCQNVRVQCQ
jgi:hypothetical protein